MQPAEHGSRPGVNNGARPTTRVWEVSLLTSLQLLVLEAHAGEVTVTAPRSLMDIALHDVLTYCLPDTTVSFIAGDSPFALREYVATEQSVTFAIDDDPLTTLKNAIGAWNQAHLAPTRWVVVPIAPDAFVIGSETTPATAPLPSLSLDCRFLMKRGDYSIFALEPVDPEACAPLQYNGGGDAGHLSSTWTGPEGAVRFEKVLDHFANSQGAGYYANCFPAPERDPRSERRRAYRSSRRQHGYRVSREAVLDLFDPPTEPAPTCPFTLYTPHPSDLGEALVREDMVRRGTSVNPCARDRVLD